MTREQHRARMDALHARTVSRGPWSTMTAAARSSSAGRARAVTSNYPFPSHALMRPVEVAALFAVGTRAVRLWAEAGRLTTVLTLGGNRRYLRAEVERLLEDGTSAWADDGAEFGR